jgi:glycosyltransferase involved in cell wall biosynthesis
MQLGGTETFHRSLLPKLSHVASVAGFVATAFHGGDGSLLHVPYATGIEAAKKLAAHCDTVVVWGLDNLREIMPHNRPRVIAVHHADKSSDWSNSSILNQLDLIDKIVCVNRGTADHLDSCGKPAHYVPNAIDPERIKPSGRQSQLRKQHGISEDAKVVLFGHRLSEEKRPQLAVEIARQLPEEWVMVIAGDGPERASVESLQCDRVRIVGAVESLADWLAVSDCFLSLSTYEGFGLSIGEAMAAGLPTVSTPSGIAPGLATTLPTDSTADEWAAAIVSAKIKVQSSEILERFSVDRMVDAWADVLKTIPRAKE